MKMLVSLITLALAAGSTTSAGEPQQGTTATAAAAPVESFILENVEDINGNLERFAEADEDWVLDPVKIALNVVEQGGEAMEERRWLNIEFEGDGSERPDSCTVTVITDGYLDDSMRGEWCRFTMVRDEYDMWKVAEFRHAWRCWRGTTDSTGIHHPQSHERFTSEACL